MEQIKEKILAKLEEKLLSKIKGKLSELFGHIDRGDILKELGEVILKIAFSLVWILLLFYFIWSPKDGYYGGGISVVDQFSGFQYYIDDVDEGVTVMGVINGKGIKDGCLEIPDSFWGRPVTTVSIQKTTTNEKIVSVHIPDSVTTISWMNVGGIQEVTGGANVKKIAGQVFWRCSTLERVELGNKLEEVGKEAFAECTALKEVKLGNGLHKIGESAFFGCTKLEKIDWGYSVTEIEAYAFSGCNSLKEVPHISNASEIGAHAFYGTAIESVNVNNAKYIGTKAFADSKLATIVLNEDVELKEDVFAGTPWMDSPEAKKY